MKRTWMLLAIAFLFPCGCGRTSANYTEGKLFVSGRIDGDTVDCLSVAFRAKLLDVEDAGKGHVLFCNKCGGARLNDWVISEGGTSQRQKDDGNQGSPDWSNHLSSYT